MTQNPIYKPQGRAREYGDLAINIYTGCNHGCLYCFARDMSERLAPKGRICGFGSPEPRDGIAESVKRQLERERTAGRLIFLCFTCDPYPAEIDTSPTREIIRLIKASGNAVRILTKGGMRAARDFDLLTAADWFGVTHTNGAMYSPYWREPNAAPTVERLATLLMAKERGIRTWVSCEPVFEPKEVYSLITYADYIDLYRIGKLNHRPSAINWAVVGATCVELCERHGRSYYIKDDLLAEMLKANIGRYIAHLDERQEKVEQSLLDIQSGKARAACLPVEMRSDFEKWMATEGIGNET
jgi:DNA repair photolyase